MTSQTKNRLSRESSAYLLQHASNPVDWYGWGKEALGKAKTENKPIFLSIGYSACHWCHVMEKESFEDQEVADILKKYFISIKVDREERPDLDHIYMAAIQALTHRGGWPLTVFLTPDLKPFYGGTYFPPTDRMGLPSFKKILLGIATAWKNRPQELKTSAEELTQALSQMTDLGTQKNASQTLSLPSEAPVLSAQATHEVLSRFDNTYGGLGNSPKFFHTMDWRVVLRHWKNTGDPEALNAVQLTLDRWSQGGIYDHLGGGFHRYSTDREWLIPHFEKMLYDNALVTQLYLEAFQSTQNTNYAQVVRETLNYVIEQMTDPLGGYFSTEDADSEGVEGKFYTWSKEEIRGLLGEELSETFCSVYGVLDEGNWEGTNILHLPEPLERYAEKSKQDIRWLETSIAKSKKILLEARNERIRPQRDEKIILAWNGLMIEAMARAHQVLGEELYLQSAQTCAQFIKKFLIQEDGRRLHHSFQQGSPRLNAFLDDYAYLINGLLALFESDFQPEWLTWAETLAELVLQEFFDPTHNCLFFTPKTHENLIFRPKEYQDGALPSPTSMMITALARLGKLSGNPYWSEKAESLLNSHAQFILTAPLASGQMIIAWELLKNKSREIVVIPADSTESAQDFLECIRSRFYPNTVTLLKTEANKHLSLFRGRESLNGLTAAYVCEHQSCLNPMTDLNQLESVLNG